MCDRTCIHCKNEKEDENPLVTCSECKGQTHHECIERCPELQSEKSRFACLHYNRRPVFDFIWYSFQIT